MDIKKEILELLPDIFKPLWEGITSPFTEDMGNTLTILLGKFAYTLTYGTESIFATGGVVHQLFKMLQPVGVSLLALFFVIDLCKRLIYLEARTVEGVIKPCLMLIVGKILIDKSFYIIQELEKFVCLIQGHILGLAGTQAYEFSNLKIKNDLGGTLMDGIIYAVSNFSCSLIAIAMLVVLVIRQFELGMLTATAPLFFSTIGGSVGHEPFKNYIKHLCVVLFQTVFMAAATLFYTKGIIAAFQDKSGAVTMAGFQTLIGIVAFGFVIISSRTILKNAIGGR